MIKGEVKRGRSWGSPSATGKTKEKIFREERAERVTQTNYLGYSGLGPIGNEETSPSASHPRL